MRNLENRVAVVTGGGWDIGRAIAAIRQKVADATLVGREGEAEDVANAVLFLASEASSYINGASIEINGGLNFV